MGGNALAAQPKKLQAYGFNGWDVLKVLAVFCMFVDHACAFFYDTDEAIYWMRAIGRGAAPIFLFLTGYAKQYRFNKELLLLALTLAVFDWVYFWHVNTLNILFTILISRMIFDYFESRGQVLPRPHEWVVGAIALFTTSAFFEYGSIGFLIAFSGYLIRHKDAYKLGQAERLSIICFVIYTAWEIVFSKPPINPYIVVVIMSSVYVMLLRLPEKRFAIPVFWERLLKPISRYSGYIYVAHLIAFMVISGRSP